MSKSFRQFVSEVARPVAGDEIDFMNKHVTILIDYPIDVEDQFTGGDIKKFTRLADYKNGKDVQVYEANLNIQGEDEINDAEEARHDAQEVLKKIIDEACGDDEDLKEEYTEILSQLSEENINYALDNDIDLIDFAKRFV